MAMLSWAANRVGLVWNPPPCPEPSRLDDWFLGVARAGSQPPTPVPFFPEVHEELTGMWKAPFTARNHASGPSSLTTLDGGAAKGYTRIPPVERAVAMQLCPNSTLRGEPSLPSRACKHSSDLNGRAYQACGEAASALHAMALLQVHQAKALRDMHEGGHDPQVHHELRAATDLVLRATKVTARAVGRAMSTLVVQERHLWLCLADMIPTKSGSLIPPCPRLASLATRSRTSPSSSVVSGSEEGSESSGRSKTSPLSSTSSVASGQQRAVRDGHPSLSCTPCPAVEPDKCCTAHSDPAMGRLPKRAPRAASLRSTSLPHCGYAGGPLGPTCAVSASLVSAPQSVSLAHSDLQARLCFTSVKAVDTHVLRAEIAVLLAKDAIELVPPADMRSGFYSPYFIVPKKSGGLRPILDLRVLNRSLHKLPFKMLMHKRIFECIRPRDWFAEIDLKEAYFHVSILPRHRPFLRFTSEGRAYQYKVLPFGLALSPCVFTNVVGGALVPMREQGVRILNYLDDWLILAQSREQLCEHRDLVLSHLSQLGLQVNWEKSKLAPV